MYRYKDLHFRFSADTCTSTFVTANIFPWYLLIRENFANEAVPTRKLGGGQQGLITSNFITLTLTISFFEHQIPLLVASQFRRGNGEDCTVVLISYHFRFNPLRPSLQHCVRLPDIQGQAEFANSPTRQRHVFVNLGAMRRTEVDDGLRESAWDLGTL